ncbi:MAG: UDP-N-acetylmuramoyl-L-alanine--D-glutamate ligase [Ruminococcaceae bacterium]|nr:UDP-N-acetylmuramoyl-L-alanine--D-glutamate ligase [Oscillospiraceae bacterium]
MSAIQEYLQGLQGKRVAVIGIGVSNTPLIRMLLGAGISVTACDKRSREQFDGPVEELERLGAELKLGEDYLEGLDHDVIFRTPGLRHDLPQMQKAREQGSEITSEMEVFFKVCPCRIIAVTGSDGKTTTTTLISEMLKAAGYTVHVGGNIGKPLLPEVEDIKADDIAVLELSSFQLLTMGQSPNIAVVTNLAPNHLDMHKGMDEYIAAKENIYLHQSAADKLVLNADNDITVAFAPKARGEVAWFSRVSTPERGVYLRGDNVICARGENGEREIMSAGDILLPGIHNVENYMTAIAAVDGLVGDEAIRQVATTFGGVEHRIELVRVLDGVRYYNDSIGTSPSRTKSGLRSFDQKVILIAGGYDKKIPFDELGCEIVEHVKHLILTGDTAEKIRAAVEQAPKYEEGKPPITMVDDFKNAICYAREIAEEGDVVILSPACAAFDRFRNFMERGKFFKQIVNEF